MLEHLLLLPRNAPLFAERRLHTVVLDEIHTYAGAQAIEVACLLRKLRNKLRLAHPVQCIGTSASHGEGADAEAKTKRFASDLFGADVAESCGDGARRIVASVRCRRPSSSFLPLGLDSRRLAKHSRTRWPRTLAMPDAGRSGQK